MRIRRTTISAAFAVAVAALPVSAAAFPVLAADHPSVVQANRGVAGRNRPHFGSTKANLVVAPAPRPTFAESTAVGYRR